ncbi:MAG: septum formation initiator family protein [Gemmatimonadaceae bacterium]|nr:septum formation initiator family protein [Gemmatimonadaceae bacterium]
MAGRVVFWILVLGAALFALQGGEYSTRDLWRQRQIKLRLTAETDSLAREVDSLRREAHAIRTDPATQERIAREQFGMVKGDKEILYRLGEQKDSAPTLHRTPFTP